MKTIQTTTIICLFLLLFSSCDDFLSKNPDNIASLDTPENIAGLLVSAYPQYSHIWFSELMSDNATDVGITAPIDELWTKQAYYWERVGEEEQDSPDGYWYSCYEAIASANHALEAVEKLEKSGTYRQSTLNPLKGEALLCRAYAHFMLVNLFAEHYDAAVADSTPGISYVTVPEVRPYVKYERRSVAEVYNLIEKDIKEGFPLLNDDLYEAPKWHFNKQAAATFISRYYLYRGLSGDWDEVIHFTKLAITDSPAGFLREWILSSNESDDIFGTNYSLSNNPANLLIMSTVSTACRAWPNRYTMDLNLVRKRVVFGDPHPTNASIEGKYAFIKKAGGNTEFGCYGVFKYAEVFKRDGINANYGMPYIMNTPLVAEEALFNRMEAEVMKENYTKVTELLNLYYSTRVIGYDSLKHQVTDANIQKIYTGTSVSSDIKPHFTLNAKQKTYLKCIVNIRASEFITDGQRWFDIKRMHLPVAHPVYKGETLNLKPDDLRRVIPFPQDAIMDTDTVAFKLPGDLLIPPAQQIKVTPYLKLNQ
jgi:hypothetical protein